MHADEIVLPRLPKRMTIEQFSHLPVGPPFFELIDGELIMAASPNLFHQEVIGNLYRLLDAHVVAHGLGKVLLLPLDVFLSDDCFEPDITFCLSATFARIARDNGLHGAPELAIEVLSESSYRRDLTRKRAKYAAAGVVEYWIADPDERTIRHFVFAADVEAPIAIYAMGATFESALLPGLRVAVADVFRR